MIKKFKKISETFDGTYLPIAFADISFKYPEHTLYPNLCVHHAKYGLIKNSEASLLAER